MKKAPFRSIAAISFSAILVFSGCASAAKMLDRAESAWAAGQYAAAIEYALQSYEKAVERSKDPGEIDAARSFLEERFPTAIANLESAAERRLGGSDAERETAWTIYRTLVELNRRVQDSPAGGFLVTGDFTEELQGAKEAAAEIKYERAIGLMDEDRRSSYIEAWEVLRDVESLVPGFRDAAALADECVAAGTYVVAFSDREVPFTVEDGDADPVSGIAEAVRELAEDSILDHDNPMFVEFVTAESALDAAEAGAGLFLEVQGEVRVSSEVENEYAEDGRVTWRREMDGTPVVVVTRLSDSRTETASADLDLEQEVMVEFYIQRHDTRYLDAETFETKFNNAGWMDDQLTEAESTLDESRGEAEMEVFARLEFGGIPDFSQLAQIDDPEGEGYAEVAIDSSIWKPTSDFIRYDLPEFVAFEEMDLLEVVSRAIWESAEANEEIMELVENLGD